MACYVSQLLKTIPNKRWRYRQACKLCCDTTAELDAMRSLLFLRQEWVQEAGTEYEHYDLTPNKRDAAIAHGCTPVSHRDLVPIWARKREAIARGDGLAGRNVRSPGLLGPGLQRPGENQ